MRAEIVTVAAAAGATTWPVTTECALQSSIELRPELGTGGVVSSVPPPSFVRRSRERSSRPIVTI